MRQIPLALRNDIIILIEKFVKRIANLTKSKNQYRHQCQQLKNTLSHFGLNTHGSINEDTSSRASIHRRLDKIKKSVKYHEQQVSELIDLSSVFALQSVRQNETAIDVLRDAAQEEFVKQHNNVIKKLNNDTEYTHS